MLGNDFDFFGTMHINLSSAERPQPFAYQFCEVFTLVRGELTHWSLLVHLERNHFYLLFAHLFFWLVTALCISGFQCAFTDWRCLIDCCFGCNCEFQVMLWLGHFLFSFPLGKGCFLGEHMVYDFIFLNNGLNISEWVLKGEQLLFHLIMLAWWRSFVDGNILFIFMWISQTLRFHSLLADF